MLPASKTGFLLAAVLSAAGGLLSGEPLSAVERQRLLAHLDLTEAWLADETAHLSATQQTFRPGPGKWSVLECVEHLAIAEPQYWQQFEQARKEGSEDRKPKLADGEMFWYGTDRTEHNKTGEARVPKGQYKDVASALASFRKLRSDIKEYTRTSSDDIRGRAYKNTDLDGYLWILMISTHSQRHILQVREIKSDAKFPRK